MLLRVSASSEKYFVSEFLGQGVIIIHIIFMRTIIIMFVAVITLFPPLCPTAYIKHILIREICCEFRSEHFI